MATQIDIGDVVLDFSQGSEAIDLVDLPLGAEILRRASLHFRDEALNKQFEKEMDGFGALVDSSVKGGRVGYLMKVELYVDELGTPSIPSGQLVLPVGLGREPIDAYAEFLNRDVIRGPEGKGIDESSFIWIRRGDKGLKAVSLDKRKYRSFLAAGAAEAQRRKLIGDPLGQDADGYLKIRRAAVWADLAKERADDITDQAKKAEIQTLTTLMKDAENRFNDAYQGYQITLRDAARKAEHLKLLDNIATALDVIKTGIQIGALYSSADKAANANGEPSSAREKEIENNQERIDQLREQLIDDVPRVNSLGQNLKSIEVEVKTLYEQGGVPLPYINPLLNSDVTVEHP